MWQTIKVWTTTRGLTIYPTSSDTLFAFVSAHAHTCGSTWITRVLSTVRFIHRRLIMACPDTNDIILKAMQDAAIARRVTQIREARPIDMIVVEALEKAFGIWEKAGQAFHCLAAWFVLVGTWASTRFDDLLHVAPHTVTLWDEALHLTSWRTKTHRHGKGVDYSIPIVGLTDDQSWLRKGFAAWQASPTSLYMAGELLVALHGP